MIYLISLLFLTANATSCDNTITRIASISSVSLEKPQKQTISLEGIQDSILVAFNLAFSTEDPSRLDKIGSDLDELSKQRDLSIVHYWRAYQGYYKAIYLLSSGDKKEAEKVIDKQIDLLSDLKNKNTEDYALLGLIRSFSIQFKAFIRAPFISNSVRNDIEKALELDPENPRAFYVNASSDYYTPKSFGGGKKAEKLLLKVIELPSQKTPNPVLPSWGKLNAYELLLQFYIREGEAEKALNTSTEAEKQYPDNYRIRAIVKRVKDMQ